METTNKNPLLSKTLWVALLTAIFAFIPVVQTWISAHPAEFSWIVAAVFGILRLITKGKVAIE